MCVRVLRVTKRRFATCSVGIVLTLLCLFVYHLNERESQRIRTQVINAALGSRNAYEFVKPHEETVLLDSIASYVSPRLLDYPECRTAVAAGFDHRRNKNPAPVPFALIVVLSHIGPDTEINRGVIRQTWYNWADAYNVRIVFFLGIPPSENFTLSRICQEAMNYNDIVIDDVMDTYYSLTVKMLRVFKWLNKTYPDENSRPKFVVKADHDVFLNIPNLIRHLKTVADVRNFVGGRIHTEAEASRSGSDKWYTPPELWPERLFPPYAGGPCYFMSGAVVPKIYETSLKERLFHLEDVFITGIVASRRLGIRLEAVPSELMPHSPYETFDSYDCIMRNFICKHPCDSETMLKYYLLINSL